MRNDFIDKVLAYLNENPSRYDQRSLWSLAQRTGATKEEVVEAKRRFKMEPSSYEPYAKTIKTNYEKDEVEGNIVLPQEPKDKRELFKFFNLEEDEWEISRIWGIWKNEKYHTSVLFKPREINVDPASEFKDYIDEYLSEKLQGFTYPSIQYQPDQRRNLALVLCLFDVHLGRLAYENYTGNTLTLKDTVDLYNLSVDKLLSNLPKERVEQIILPIGNDFFNVDDTRLTSTRGTPQINTHNLHGMFKEGLSLITETILKLVQIAPVQVILVPGNHDNLSSTYLAVAVERVFESHPNIFVDSRPIDRKYVGYGNVALCFSHGELKPDKYAELFPYEGKEYFINSTHNEVLLGHIHHERTYGNASSNLFVVETGGVTVRYLSSLTKKDLWTFKEGYTLSKRRAFAILYHKTEGKYMEYVHTDN